MCPSCLGKALLVLGLGASACGGSDAKEPVYIPVTACSETFNLCGGDIVGTWELTTVCADGSAVDLYNAMLAADSPGCADTFRSAALSTTGNVTYDGTKYSRSGSVKVKARLEITAVCVAEQLLGLALTATSCKNLAQVLPARFPNSTFQCSYDNSTCNCDMDSLQPFDGSGTYTISGGNVLSESDGTSYGFCVDGKTMTQSTTYAPNMTSGIAHLRRK